MDLLERMARQPGHIARLPKRQVRKVIAERDAYWLKVQAFDRLMRQQAKRRQVERTARAIANNPKPRM